MRHLVNEACSLPNAVALVLTTTCDQMRRAAEMVQHGCPLPVFLMNIPVTWQDPSKSRTYLSELSRLGQFLCELGGQQPAPALLSQTMASYEKSRDAVLQTRNRGSSRSFAEALAAFSGAGRRDQSVRELPLRTGGIPLALVGGPVTKDALQLLDLIDQYGGRVALDGTESGERSFPAHFDRRRLTSDPLAELVDAYFATIPMVFRRPNSAIYQWMSKEFAAHNIRGVVLLRHLWCDLWHAEVQRIREWTSLPVVDLDLSSDAAGPTERNRTRIQALLEAAQTRRESLRHKR